MSFEESMAACIGGFFDEGAVDMQVDAGFLRLGEGSVSPGGTVRAEYFADGTREEIRTVRVRLCLAAAGAGQRAENRALLERLEEWLAGLTSAGGLPEDTGTLCCRAIAVCGHFQIIRSAPGEAVYECGLECVCVSQDPGT